MTKSKRATANHTPQWDGFIQGPSSLNQPYNNQYFACYNARLEMLRDRCLSNVNESNPIVPKIIELLESKPSTAVGIIIKDISDRPKLDSGYHSSFEGVSYLGTPFEDDNNDGDNQQPFQTFCSSSDSVFLEDSSGRIELEGDFDMDCLATGIVVAIEGVVGATGVLNVSNVHFPSKAPQDTSSADEIVDDDDVKIMLLSGLDCGGSDGETSLKRELLVDFLTGHFSTEEGSNIARVVIAGGGCTKPIKPENISPNWSSGSNNKISAHDKSNITLPVRELDLFLGELVAGGVPVDFIPGLHDPTNANWPQKPMHPCLLPSSGCFINMLSRSTNPYKAKIGDKSFLGSDGLNIMDLRRYIAKRVITNDADEVDDEGNMLEPKLEFKETSPLEALESALKYNHIAPTGPDSLPTFPFEETDPFVIEDTPHVFFAGNCDDFETKLVKDGEVVTRLVCVPSFLKTGKAVILGLKSMECAVIEFADAGEENSNGSILDEKKINEGE